MRRILVIDYSQTGQTRKLRDSICGPLQASSTLQVDYLELQPEQPFPFPWPVLRFFEIFPETVQMKPVPLKPTALDMTQRYDLILLCYQVWFLSPSLPISSFLQSHQAEQLFRDTPVVTVIGCRNMWLQAQEKVKQQLQRLQARLVDNVVLTDQCGSAASFIATPLWMFTGKQKAWSWVPRAGIDAAEMAAATRFGEAIAKRLQQDDQPITAPMLQGLGAVTINEKLMASEHIGNRSFQIWSRLLIKLGAPGSIGRRLGLMIYVVFLVTLILTVVPISALIKALLRPLLRQRLNRARAYFAGPSGECREKLQD
jgi:hypothetical protein